jgi:diphthamide synthase (EF-2-diphthine--ammonia ligase)
MQVAFGGLFLEDVRRYREERLAGTGLTPLFPLFGIDTAALAREMIAFSLAARITRVNPLILDRDFAGRDFDASLLADLPPTVDRAENVGSSIRSRTQARCSADRSRFRAAWSSNATGLCSRI